MPIKEKAPQKLSGSRTMLGVAISGTVLTLVTTYVLVDAAIPEGLVVIYGTAVFFVPLAVIMLLIHLEKIKLV